MSIADFVLGQILMVRGNMRKNLIGLNQKEMIQVIAETAEQYRSVGKHLGDMQKIILSEDEKIEFAMKAVSLREPLRFINKEDKTINVPEITKSLDPRELFKPV